VGVRRRLELEALLERKPDICVIWVSRPGFEPDGLDNLDITPQDDNVHIRICNDRTIEDLADLAQQIADGVMTGS